MATTLTDDVLQDDIAVSLARVLALTNRKARESGVDAFQSLITIAQHPLDNGFVWRVNYGRKSYVGRRGGDLIIEVDPDDLSIRKVLRGQ